MSSDDQRPRNLPPAQSIPLQNLSRPPDAAAGVRSRPRVETPEGGRSYFEQRPRLAQRTNGSSLYRDGGSDSTSRTGEQSDNERLNIPYIQTPSSTHRPGVHFDDGELSPTNVGEYQSAQVGLSFDTPAEERTPNSAHYNDEPASDAAAPAGGEADDYFPTNDDRAPLNDSRYHQPISGSPLSHGSASRRSRQKSTPGAAFPGRMLGDDLAAAANRRQSLHSSRMSRSMSVSASPLSSAGDMLRKMSQRVVNLSNEPAPIEQEMLEADSARTATLNEPFSLPQSTEYNHDEQAGNSPPPTPEKAKLPARERPWRPQTNPLRGRSLGLFPPDSPLRLWLCELLTHPITEPLILLLIFLQTVVLTVESAPNLFYGQPRSVWIYTPYGWILLVLFIVYTLEIVAKMIVSGFAKNAYEYSTHPGLTTTQTIRMNLSFLFGSPRNMSKKSDGQQAQEFQPSVLRSFTSMQPQLDARGHGRHAQRLRLARRAFLRHSFNRLDFIAVASFWVSVVLSLTGIEIRSHIYVFQMLSCSRILRLLNLTSGTSVILRSLKKAAPLLVHVAFLICFFWLLFAIVGVQSFKSSLGRTCHFLGNDSAVDTFIDPDTSFGIKQNLVSAGFDVNDAANGPVQFCGGSFSNNGPPLPYFDANFNPMGDAKGFWCPQGSVCLEGLNIYNNSVSFDNIGNSLELVFVVMSSNTFSDILYYTTDSDSLAGSLFFIFGIIIMSFWLMNLLVAVITSNFQVIREESKRSAFAMDEKKIEMDGDQLPKKRSSLRRAWDLTYWLWILVITIDLIVMATRSSESSADDIQLINTTETVVTLLLLIEIVIRFLVDWRNFFRSKRNWMDLFLAVATSVVQIPVIHNSGQVYNVLTIFQILRVYRVVHAVPFVRDMTLLVLGNVSGIFNLIVFVFLVTFLAAIFAVQLLRAELPQYGSDGNFIRVTFANIFNAFLGMYQILSSENWTAVMYSATSFEESFSTSWISAAFFILWFTFANFIILNMFIAVIQENFDVSEDEKRLYQVKAFLQQKELTGSRHGNLSLSAVFRFGREKRRQDPIDFGPATIEMFKDTVVQDFLDEQMEQLHDNQENDAASVTQGNRSNDFFRRTWSRIEEIFWRGEPNPFYSGLTLSRPYEELDPRTMAQEIVSAADQRKKAQRQYLSNHPRYNVSLYIFTPQNPIRRFCQSLVGPGHGGNRAEGLDPIKTRWYTFSFFIYTCIAAMVILACLATPLYQRDFFNANGGFQIRNWFVWTDLAFAIIFSVESLIKVIADGFFFTPNAYCRGIWGFMDCIVLITLWVSVAASLFNLQDVARTVGAFKALRALRLLNISDSARDTFHAVIILGGWKLLSAMFVALSLLIPFAIYGLNLFNGRLVACNDTSSIDFFANPSLTQCVGEYQASPFSWNVTAPRVVQNRYFSFDNFGDSLFILFQILSQEGWIDVMWGAISARSVGEQPINNFNPANGMFFVVFNLLGAVFVLTLFVSIFMRNYTEQTGVAYLTSEQRSWLELRKLLRQISPSKRPSNQPNKRWKNWCYRTAVNKHGTWQRMITAILCVHLILLASESYPGNDIWDDIASILFTIFVFIYIANIVIRVIGLTWKRFRRSSWDLYSLFSVSGTVILTVLNFAYDEQQQAVRQLQKLFLVSIALLLIPRNNQLDQLFKTAAASFTAIATLLLTWGVLFLVFAIALTQTLGLTKFGSMGLANLNFRNVPKALILLFRMSCGEGWNQIMEDFANAQPPTCIIGDSFFNSDCGSVAWAEVLFVAWNILSMYIFVSMFVSLIFESFSYVYQQSSGMSILSREEIRRFKQAWATFDPDGTGFIPKEAFPRLLGELSGVFAMRIYDGEHSVRQILEDCQVDARTAERHPGVVEGIDLAKLNRRLRTIDVAEIRRRRQRLNIFSQEILVSADPDRGVGFLSCLLILSHYNVISDSKSLRLEEFLRRRYRLQRVEEEVQRRIVIGFFDTLYWSRAFRRRKELSHSARVVDIPQFAVPEIFVDDQDATSPSGPVFPADQVQHQEYDQELPARSPSPAETRGSSSRPGSRGSSPGRGTSGEWVGASNAPAGTHLHRGWSFRASSPDGRRSTDEPSLFLSARAGPGDGFEPLAFDGGDVTPPYGSRRSSDAGAASQASPTSPGLPASPSSPASASSQQHRIPRREVGGMLSPEFPPPAANGSRRHRRQQSSVGLESFDNSAWGESIRRSFTVRRQPTRSSRSRPPSDV